MEVLNNGRFGMAAALSGTQKQLIHRAADFAANRKQFTDKIMDYGAIQEKLARLSANHYATESIAYLVSQAMDAKVAPKKQIRKLNLLRRQTITWKPPSAKSSPLIWRGYARTRRYRQWVAWVSCTSR